MPIFQYQCEKCSSMFEHLVSSAKDKDVACVACGSKKIKRLHSSRFGIQMKLNECNGCEGRAGACPFKRCPI
jgi:putative FmdB family regulatory protein